MILANGWHVNIAEVTPTFASAMLEQNHGNRTLRRGAVANYASLMEAGKWMCSPDGIIVAKSGRLLQGQHRLMAVVASGCTVQMVIWREVDEDVFPVLDRGIKRTLFDAIGEERRLTEAAAFIARYSFTNHTFTDEDVRDMVALIAPEHNLLMAATNSSTKKMSSAPIRAAACIMMMSGYDKEYICNVYQSLVLRRLGELPPVAQAFVGWTMKAPKLGGAAAQVDLFARASVFFNPERREQTRIQINSNQGAIDHMRKIVGFAGLLKGR